MILNDVAELLSIAGRAARVDVQHDIAPGGHPLKFMVEDPPISSVRPAVNVQNQRIFLLGVEIGRLLNPRLNTLSVKACVRELFGRGQVELRPERLVDVSDTALGAVLRDREKIADHDWCRDQSNDVAGIGRDRKVEHGLIAVRDFANRARLGVDANQGSASLLFHQIE